MKRKNATRSALFTSIISLLLCVSMLVGTTFAWFTDEVVSGTNVIAAGNLDVELFYSKTKDFSDEKKVDSQTLLFTDKDGNEIKHWEPGVVAYTNLQVANVGTLALTYRMTLNFGNMNYVEYAGGSKYDLSDVLKVAIVDGGFDGDRAEAHALSYDYDLEAFHLAGELEGNTTTETIGVVIYWKPGTNEHDNLFNMNNGKKTSDEQPLRVELGINLFATQEEYEKDSFDELYDEEADNTIAAGEVVRYDDPAQNITESFVNNGTLIIEGGEVNKDGYALDNRGTANLESVEVNAGNPSNYALISRGSDAVTTLDDVALTSGGGAIGAVDGATVIVNSGDYKVDSASTSGRYLIYTEGAGSTVIVNGGTFSWDKNDNQKRAYVYADADTTVMINGGTFGKASTRSGYTAGILGSGEVIIKGGTFGFNPTKWVALGYEAIKSGDTWTVSAIPPVENDAALSEAIASGETEIVLAAGNYELPDVKGKNITLIGAGPETVVDYSDMGGYQEVAGSSFSFNNMTVKCAEKGYPYPGLQHTTSVSYEDCHIEGTVNLFCPATFTNCTFDSKSAEHNVVTYGSDSVTFTDCDFTYGDRAVNCYAENASSRDVNVTFNNCTFTKVAGKETTGAIETNSSFMNSLTLTINNCTINEGRLAYISEYDTTAGAKTDITVNGEPVHVVFVGNKWANEETDAAALAAALTADRKNIEVVLLEDVNVPISSLGQQTGGSGEYKLGGEGTESIVIDLNGKKLNITTTYWSAIGAKNANATITIKNGDMTSTGNSAGTWNAWDLRFSNCNWNFENIDFLKAVALDNAGKATNMKNVTITDSHNTDTYALWITAEGQTVTIDGLTIDMLAATDGRGIKIDNQYVSASEKVTLNVSNATFKTEEKAAIMVNSPAGAAITLENVVITNVAADSTNVVWVDADAAAYADKVTVTGGSVITEA